MYEKFTVKPIKDFKTLGHKIIDGVFDKRITTVEFYTASEYVLNYNNNGFLVLTQSNGDEVILNKKNVNQDTLGQLFLVKTKHGKWIGI